MIKTRKQAICGILFVILFSFSFVSFAAEPRDQLPWDPSVVRGRLDNGLEYFIMANKKPEQRVELRLAVKAGALLEPDGKIGLAHYIEHMGFNGTTNFAPGELVKYFDSIGVEWGPDTNAYTSEDHTVYMLTLPTDTPEPLDKGLMAMADYAGGMLFLPDEIDKERGVILEERRLSRVVEMRILEKAIPIVLKDTRYAREGFILGTEETIKSLKQPDFIDFYRKWYRPDLMALVVVGDIDPGAVERKIKEKFSGLVLAPDAEKLPIYGDAPHADIHAGIITDKELPVSMVMVIFTRDPTIIRTRDEFRRDVIQGIAVGVYSSRLDELSLSKNPPFKEAYVDSSWSMLGFDIVGIGAMAQMKQEKKALTALMIELERIRRFGVLDEELQEQKRRIGEALRTQAQERDKRDSGPIAGEIAYDSIYGDVFLDVLEQRKLFEQIKDSITIEDIKAEVEKLFEPRNMSALLVLPDFQKSMYKEQDVLDAVAEARKADIQPYARETAKKSADYSTLKPGNIVERKTFDEIGVTEVRFDNGLRVFIKPTDFQKDEIIFSGFTYGGVLFENYGNRGAGRLVSAAWMLGGTRDLNSIQIDRLMSGKTIGISPNGRENYSLRGRTVGKDLEETLQWVRDYLTVPGFRDEGVAKAKALMIDEIKNANASQDGTVNIVLRELVCPGNPMAYQPSEAEISRLTADDIRAIHGLASAPAAMEYTFVGSLDVDKTIELLAKYLGSIPPRPPTPAPEAAAACVFPQGLTRRTIYKGMENRSSTTMIFPGPTVDSDDTPALYVLAKIADIRMNNILREDMSGTYYAYMYPGFNPYIKNRNFIEVGFATDPGRVEELIRAAMQIFTDLKEQGPTEEEIKTAREIFARDHEEELKQNGYWLGTIAGSDTAGLPLDLDLKIQKRIQEVKAGDIKAAAGKYLLGGTRIELIAMPEQTR